MSCPAEIKWIKWWEGTFDEATGITKLTAQKDGKLFSHYVILPMLEVPGGRTALTCLSVNGEAFGKSEKDIMAYLVEKKAEFERTLSYGKSSLKETPISILTGLENQRQLYLEHHD